MNSMKTFLLLFFAIAVEADRSNSVFGKEVRMSSVPLHLAPNRVVDGKEHTYATTLANESPQWIAVDLWWPEVVDVVEFHTLSAASQMTDKVHLHVLLTNDFPSAKSLETPDRHHLCASFHLSAGNHSLQRTCLKHKYLKGVREHYTSHQHVVLWVGPECSIRIHELRVFSMPNEVAAIEFGAALQSTTSDLHSAHHAFSGVQGQYSCTQKRPEPQWWVVDMGQAYMVARVITSGDVEGAAFSTLHVLLLNSLIQPDPLLHSPCVKVLLERSTSRFYLNESCSRVAYRHWDSNPHLYKHRHVALWVPANNSLLIRNISVFGMEDLAYRKIFSTHFSPETADSLALDGDLNTYHEFNVRPLPPTQSPTAGSTLQCLDIDLGRAYFVDRVLVTTKVQYNYRNVLSILLRDAASRTPDYPFIQNINTLIDDEVCVRHELAKSDADQSDKEMNISMAVDCERSARSKFHKKVSICVEATQSIHYMKLSIYNIEVYSIENSKHYRNILSHMETLQHTNRIDLHTSSMAIDGDASTCAITQSWWSVDLGRRYFVEEVSIITGLWTNEPLVFLMNILYYLDFIPDFINEDKCSVQKSQVNEVVSYWCRGGMIPYQFVTVRPRFADEELEICELRVYASEECPVGFYGRRCEKRCNCKENAPCAFDTGSCSHGCLMGWHGRFCDLEFPYLLNPALFRPAYQSSSLDSGFTAGYGVDLRVESCACTGSYDRVDRWWVVDLGRKFIILDVYSKISFASYTSAVGVLLMNNFDNQVNPPSPSHNYLCWSDENLASSSTRGEGIINCRGEYNDSTVDLMPRHRYVALYASASQVLCVYDVKVHTPRKDQRIEILKGKLIYEKGGSVFHGSGISKARVDHPILWTTSQPSYPKYYAVDLNGLYVIKNVDLNIILQANSGTHLYLVHHFNNDQNVSTFVPSLGTYHSCWNDSADGNWTLRLDCSQYPIRIYQWLIVWAGAATSLTIHDFNVYFAEICLRGFYGPDCMKRCNCKDLSPCLFTTGVCLDECEFGWHGPSCDQRDVCPRGFYGRDCSIDCGCIASVPCDVETGQCRSAFGESM